MLADVVFGACCSRRRSIERGWDPVCGFASAEEGALRPSTNTTNVGDVDFAEQSEWREAGVPSRIAPQF